MSGPYLAAVERAFLARLGRGLMLSAADVELVTGWQRAGYPVEAVLDGVEAAFSRPGLVLARVRRLSFARSFVEDAARAHASRRAGALPIAMGESSESEPPAVRLRRQLQAVAEREGMGAALATRLLERTAAWSDALDPTEVFARWEPLLAWALAEAWSNLEADARAQLEGELEQLLAPERKRVDPTHFAETWRALRDRLLRSHLGLPSTAELEAEA